MLTTKDKEDIHISYLSAVCASASISFDLQRHDDDSTDGIVKKLLEFEDGTKYMSSLRIQLKCTSSLSQYTDCGDKIVRTFRLCRNEYTSDLDSCAVWELPSTITDDTMHLTA